MKEELTIEDFNRAVEVKTSPETLKQLMEEMANQPKEEHGKRQPGERCMYEINCRGLSTSSGDFEKE